MNLKGVIALAVAGFLALVPVTAAQAGPPLGPPAVTGVTLTGVDSPADGGYILTLSWDATGAYGGFAQPDFYAYDINKNGAHEYGTTTNSTSETFFAPYGDGDIYDFSVTAAYEGDSAEVTYSNTFDASPAAPYQMPYITGVQVTNINNIDGSFDVSWDEATDFGNSPFQHYKVLLYQGGLQAGSGQTQPGTTTLTFYNVLPGEYDVMVHGVTDFGDGEESDPVAFSIAEITGASGVNNLDVARATTQDGFDISWDTPDTDGGADIEYYRVEVTDLYASDPTAIVFADIVTVGEPLTSSTTGLVAGHRYNVSVWAVNAAAKDGSVSSISQFLGQIDPDAPTDVVITKIDSTRVLVEWADSAYNGGASDFRYLVTITGSPFWLTVDSAYTSDNFAVFEVGNHPGVSYTASVQADGYDGYQSAATAASGTVSWDATAPSDLTVFASTEGVHDPKISASWSAESNGSDITGYYVTVKKVGSSDVIEAVELGAGQIHYTFEATFENDAEYRVTVTAYNAIGDVSSNEVVTTLAYVPDAPDESDFSTVITYDVTVEGDVGKVKVTNGNPGDWVYGYVFSTPIALGWVQLDSNRVATFSLAGLNLPNGTHTFAVLNASGALVGTGTFVVNNGVVTPADAITKGLLAATGSEPSALLAFALLSVLAGAAVVRLARRKDAKNLV